ncbi:MAG: glycine betaine ABC transporter substrate-binding protein [Woeseiaceae bacterium]
MTLRGFFIMTAALLVSCSAERSAVVVGSNDFTEQKIVAEIMALTLEEHGMRAERQIPSGDNRRNLLALQSGQLDVYPAYDGFLATLGRYPVVAGEEIVADASSVPALLGLQLLQPFGYRSDFAVAVRHDVAIRYSLQSISDLARLEKPLRFVTDEGHATRPVDGLAALARHYGLVLGEVKTVPLRDRRAAYEALLDREADAAIVFDLDAQARSFGMRILEDDLDFFPEYRAAPLLRASALESRPEIGAALATLAGKLSDETVRSLVERVDFGGEDYQQVARDFLGDVGVLETSSARAAERAQVVLAIDPLARFGELAVRAFRAIREVMPARKLAVEITEQPVAALKRGDARYALLGSDAFFELVDGEIQRVNAIEAVGVVGDRFAHLLALRESAPLDQLERVRIGVGAEGDSSYRIARFLESESRGERVTVVPVANSRESIRRLRVGDIDAIFLMGSTAHAGLMALLASDSMLELRSLDEVLAPATLGRFPFLRRARIPANSYPGQPGAIESFSTQVVLAAGRLENESALGDVGPANTPGLRLDEQQRVRSQTARALHAALGAGEDVDPILPMSQGLLPTADDSTESIQFQPMFALTNVIAIAFLVWVAVLYFRPLPQVPALRPGDGAEDNGNDDTGA